MWIKTKDGRYYNLDKVTALDIKQSEKNSREYILYAIIDGKRMAAWLLPLRGESAGNYERHHGRIFR